MNETTRGSLIPVRSSNAVTRRKLSSSRRLRASLLGVALGVCASVSAAPAAGRFLPAHAKTPTGHRWFAVGKASWYGGAFNGHKTASGERFDENRLTCAHRSLPLGSWIRVTNLQNNKSTVVRVTDRGPFVKNVILDLSHAAARQLGFSSTARVRIDQLHPEDAAEDVARVDVPATAPTIHAGQ